MIRGGRGVDAINAGSQNHRPVDINLATGVALFAGGRVRLHQIEDVFATGVPTTVVGTDGPNLIDVFGPASIRGRGGDDVITTHQGDDHVLGGRGDDSMNGGEGDDTLAGGPGADDLRGSPGDDTLDGGPELDTIHGGAGTDTCTNGEIVTSCP